MHSEEHTAGIPSICELILFFVDLKSHRTGRALEVAVEDLFVVIRSVERISLKRLQSLACPNTKRDDSIVDERGVLGRCLCLKVRRLGRVEVLSVCLTRLNRVEPLNQRLVLASPGLEKRVALTVVDKRVVVGKDRRPTQELVQRRINFVLRRRKQSGWYRVSAQHPEVAFSKQPEFLGDPCDGIQEGRSVSDENDGTIKKQNENKR